MNPLHQIRSWYLKKTRPEFVPIGMTYPCYPPPGGGTFVHGLEMLNDSATPILFAMKALNAKAGLPQREAAVAVAICHENGGVLVPMPSFERATEVADQIVNYARQESWPMVCRAVSAPAHLPPEPSEA
jgi:ATP-dependent Clp protease adapter protein ClpS